MASSTIAETDHPLATVEAKMIVATGRDQCQQLKDVVSKEDPSSLLVVVASGNQTSTPPNKPGSPSPAMDPGLLAVARSGSSQTLESFLNGEGRRRSSSLASGDEEAFLGQDQEPLLDGVTAGGDTALHVVAGAKGDSDEVLKKARLIYSKAGNLLLVQNNKGDTPLHCAAREGSNVKMVSLLINLAKGQDNNANRVKALLETENKRKWTVLHEAVQNGQIDHVELLMEEDPQLASFQKDGISPMYLAILLERKNIAEALYEKSGEHLSYSGPNGQNALHAAVLRRKGSCWAFSMVGAVEGINAITTGNLLTLSEQQVLDCSGNGDCGGGYTYDSFYYVQNTGLTMYQCGNPPYYPAYKAQKQTCRFDPNKPPVVKIDAVYYGSYAYEADLKQEVFKQPVSVLIEATSSAFQSYREGVFTGLCGIGLNHAVLIVGYGATADGTKYWIVKNSWGDQWGEKGYIRMKRDTDDMRGLCGIAMYPMYPIKNAVAAVARC